MKAAPIEVACACRNSYPSEPDLQGEHVSMANKLLGIFLFLILSACSAPLKAPTTDERTVRQDSGEVEKPPGTTEGQTAATPSAPRCTKQLKQGYALRERIDNEYWQSRRAGTFRDQRDEFTARWGKEAGIVGRRDKSRSSSNWWADSEEPIPKCTHTYRHGEWGCAVEQYQKFSSDEIGSPSVDLQGTLASPTPMFPPVL